ncbi:hypothetical protein GBA52_027202 [Prunus armeniaca]|nr:hypothetical protein GBA52_027202 [Prunus armeniaca]
MAILWRFSKMDELVADMPLKICYPALEGQEWQNHHRQRSQKHSLVYHNGGSWPTLLWQLIMWHAPKLNRPEIARERQSSLLRSDISLTIGLNIMILREQDLFEKTGTAVSNLVSCRIPLAKLLLAKLSAAKNLVNEEDSELANIFFMHDKFQSKEETWLEKQILV